MVYDITCGHLIEQLLGARDFRLLNRTQLKTFHCAFRFGYEENMIHNPMTAAFGNSDEMQKAIDMLGSVKDSIINAYEIKTGLSRAKLSHLMDAETWMDANKAVELGFADEIMQRGTESEDAPVPTVSMLYSKANVVNSLMEKIAAKCAITPKPTRTQKADELMDRLNLIKNWR